MNEGRGMKGARCPVMLSALISMQRIEYSTNVDTLCGYGEQPLDLNVHGSHYSQAKKRMELCLFGLPSVSVSLLHVFFFSPLWMANNQHFLLENRRSGRWKWQGSHFCSSYRKCISCFLRAKKNETTTRHRHGCGTQSCPSSSFFFLHFSFLLASLMVY